ncbi:unnamed protein product, partial [Amoebophrya sp. A120]
GPRARATTGTTGAPWRSAFVRSARSGADAWPRPASKIFSLAHPLAFFFPPCPLVHPPTTRHKLQPCNNDF